MEQLDTQEAVLSQKEESLILQAKERGIPLEEPRPEELENAKTMRERQERMEKAAQVEKLQTESIRKKGEASEK